MAYCIHIIWKLSNLVWDENFRLIEILKVRWLGIELLRTRWWKTKWNLCSRWSEQYGRNGGTFKLDQSVTRVLGVSFLSLCQKHQFLIDFSPEIIPVDFSTWKSRSGVTRQQRDDLLSQASCAWFETSDGSWHIISFSLQPILGTKFYGSLMESTIWARSTGAWSAVWSSHGLSPTFAFGKASNKLGR